MIKIWRGSCRHSIAGHLLCRLRPCARARAAEDAAFRRRFAEMIDPGQAILEERIRRDARARRIAALAYKGPAHRSPAALEERTLEANIRAIDEERRAPTIDVLFGAPLLRPETTARPAGTRAMPTVGPTSPGSGSPR